jgi:hypothetical protein
VTAAVNLVKTNPLGFWPKWLSPQVVWGFVVVCIVGTVLLKLLLRRPPKVRALDSAGRVIGIVGRMGSGKSYLAVRTAYAQLKAGAHVASNFTMRPESLGKGGTWRRFNGWADLAELHGDFIELRAGKWVAVDPWEPEVGRRRLVRRMVVIVDEAQLLASSIDQTKMPMVAQKTLGNLRKLGIDLYWLSQHESRVAKRLRDSTNEMYVCRASRRKGSITFYASVWEPEHVRKPDKMLYRMKYKFDPKIARLYDTLEVVGPDERGPGGGDGGSPVWLTPVPRDGGGGRPGGALPPADVSRWG